MTRILLRVIILSARPLSQLLTVRPARSMGPSIPFAAALLAATTPLSLLRPNKVTRTVKAFVWCSFFPPPRHHIITPRPAPPYCPKKNKGLACPSQALLYVAPWSSPPTVRSRPASPASLVPWKGFAMVLSQCRRRLYYFPPYTTTTRRRCCCLHLRSQLRGEAVTARRRGRCRG